MRPRARSPEAAIPSFFHRHPRHMAASSRANTPATPTPPVPPLPSSTGCSPGSGTRSPEDTPSGAEREAVVPRRRGPRSRTPETASANTGSDHPCAWTIAPYLRSPVASGREDAHSQLVSQLDQVERREAHVQAFFSRHRFLHQRAWLNESHCGLVSQRRSPARRIWA